MHEPDDSLKSRTSPCLGIIGGGQLARMTAMSALQLGCDVVILEKSHSSPAATLATHSLVGDWTKSGPVLDLASRVDVVTLENEFVDASLLRMLEDAGHTVFPNSSTLATVQDKFLQKQAMQAAGLDIPAMRAVPDIEALYKAVDELGLPLVLKARRNAYDGKGNASISDPSEIETAWKKLGGHNGNPLYVEAFCDFTAELAVIITRSRNGETAVYPVVETVQRDHICHLVRAPAQVPEAISSAAADVGRRAVEAAKAVGSFGVEMFLTRDGKIVVNELAPRVHNSGHYTIEACICSQFENHVRAVLGMPLGSTRMVAPAAVMVNLLGQIQASGRVGGLDEALAVDGAHVHLYGKTTSGKGRKMGHVTALGQTLAEAEKAAISSAEKIRFGSSS
jgi:5-(carboxyamino)imidazole ribonucleotide synthase